MAVNYSDLTPGTTVTWQASGGDKTMTINSLANAGIREGAKSATLVDGTKGLPEIITFSVHARVQSAATDGLELNLFLGWSSSTVAATDNPGGLTGSDAAVADSDQLAQLDFVGSIPMASSLGTGDQGRVLVATPKGIAFIPVVQNSTGQTTSATAGHTYVAMTPWYRRSPVA